MKNPVWLPWLLTSISILIGAGQFYLTNSQKNREPFLRVQMEFLIEASDTLATLATETDSIAWETSREKFWQLYLGRLAIVEDPEVEAVMICAGKIVPRESGNGTAALKNSLRNPSLSLAFAARTLILKSWKIETAVLPTLTGQVRARSDCR